MMLPVNSMRNLNNADILDLWPLDMTSTKEDIFSFKFPIFNKMAKKWYFHKMCSRGCAAPGAKKTEPYNIL